MKSCAAKLVFCFFVSAFFTTNTSAAVFYVDVNSTNPVPPYADWSTASTDIQSAIDVSADGDQIWVNDGTYQTGGRVVSSSGTTTNRVAVTKAIIIQSVNGSLATIIKGNQAPGFNGGASAVRCVFLTNGASLIGFTLTNGGTASTGSGGGVYSTSTNTIVSECLIAGNSAEKGGGAESGTLTNCIISHNAAIYSVSAEGGGTADATLYNCTVIGNVTIGIGGGGVYNGTLYNCTLTDNTNFSFFGGGAVGSTLNNCSITGNAATIGGGAYESTLNNCIVYFNYAVGGINYSNCTLNYCCTVPLPTNGIGNITLDPLLADTAHISPNSPCVGSGSAAFSSGVDIDMESWADPPSIGCDEYHSGSVTGALNVAIGNYYTSVPTNFVISFTAQINGHASSNQWDFGDGTIVNNELYLTHSWSTFGDYPVVLKVFNESFPTGITAAVTIHVVPTVTLYVSLASTNPVAPYSSWATAATNIQNAVDAVFTVPNSLVLVSNGIYNFGSRVVGSGTSTSNRVIVSKPMTVQSLNGPAVTAIQGNQVPGTTNGASAIRCIYLTNGATLVGFTLTNGATILSPTPENGGGIWCQSSSAVVSNCFIIGNSTAGFGGGAYLGTLNNCTLIGNTALLRAGGVGNGGGAFSNVLNNCMIISNFANVSGGGVYNGTLNNCILNGNSAKSDGGGAYEATLNNCTVAGNSAGSGGGSYECTLTNCIIMGNSATDSAGGDGGGAYHFNANFNGTLNNCTVFGNSAKVQGGGTWGSPLNNCIVYYNSAPLGSNYQDSIANNKNNCCTIPLPPSGTANFTNAPLFVNMSGGNLRLQTNSPCINTGNNVYVTRSTDLDGRPRVVGGAVDIGAYEFQGAGMGEFIGWLQQYGLPTDGSVDFLDSDDDGLNNWQEWKTGTIPTNAASVLSLYSPATTNTIGITVTWQSVSGMTYYLQSSTNLPAFTSIQSNLVGQIGSTSYTDATATNGGPYFYRVGVQ